MGFRFFGQQASPIAIDFGSSSVKVLQTGLGDHPNLLAAAELPKPSSEAGVGDAEDFEYLAIELPRLLRNGGFKGRNVIFAVPNQTTIIQHLQLGQLEGMKQEVAVKTQLQMQMNIAPQNTVVRSIDVTDIHRDGQSKRELICIAIPRDIVMQYVGLLESMRMQVLDVQTGVQSMVRAFDHIHRRAGDENLTTMYIDIGWCNTSVAIAHGKAITFARSMQFGGIHFDRLIAKQLGCDLTTAMEHRLALQSPVPAHSTPSESTRAAESPVNNGTSGPPSDGGGEGFARLTAAMAKERAVGEAAETTADRDRREGRAPAVLSSEVEPGEADGDQRESTIDGKIDLTETLDTVTDELSMCLRYHRGLFPDRTIDRVILLGGESRQPWLCRHIVRSLRVPARLGDPLSRFVRDDQAIESIGLAENRAQPGWAVASGLCAQLTD